MTHSGHLLRIGELAKLSGKTVRALHLYEERGLLIPAERTAGGFRQYDDQNVERIRYIERLQRLGLSLKEIQALVGTWNEGGSPRAAMARLAQTYRDQLQKIRAQMQALKVLEGELEGSLAFLDDCDMCTRETRDLKRVCSVCTHSERGGELTLLVGITSR